MNFTQQSAMNARLQMRSHWNQLIDSSSFDVAEFEVIELRSCVCVCVQRNWCEISTCHMCVTYSSVCNIVTENEWLTNPHCYDTIWWNAIPSLLYVSVKMDFIDWKMLFIYCRSTSIESSSLTANCLHRSNSVESSFLKINRMNNFECTNLCLFHNSFCFFLSLSSFLLPGNEWYSLI